MASWSPKQLTRYLERLAEEMHTVEDGGDAISKAEALATLLWNKALGYREQVLKGGEWVEVNHPPESWAIHLVYDRLEGRVNTNDKGKDTGNERPIHEKVAEIAKARLNSAAEAAANAKGRTGRPPKIIKKEG
ncbi:hypothetical protein LCGC14_1841010 [marine sediment metagenome]|uniref:Uncharacterized protein n=1 Tax=marine sediment metagenome TaxID=412755 RepID=A0A0F9JCP9_9ZZZZ